MDMPATQWAPDEIDRIAAAEELRIAPLRLDGTFRKPVTIWVVRVGDHLFIRSYRGPAGHWFRGALVRHQGRIQAGGLEKIARLIEETDRSLNDQIDAAYRAKYRRYEQYVNPMVTPDVRATTLRLTPIS